ncbi:FadR/GntR family transcriptional regulator [Halioxenophilus aromaticivorans]|uniref:FadR/GntR family transcriptional regulator n=1 Tax=Halioxenophilus aromaticivorans TaxID=1306992 RepID=A0AAV3UAY9_9ALTE
MRIEAVKVRRLYLEVASQIENLIKNGEVDVGQRLPSERDLSDQFGVSRPTIREAMIALEIAGLVEIRTGSGIYVLGTQPKRSIQDVGPGAYEILEARRLIEPELAALAADNAKPAQLDDLAKALADMECEQSASSVSEAADKRFHSIIADASGNSALAAVVDWLWQMRMNSELSTVFHQRARDAGVHPSLDQHKAVFTAIAAKESEAARSAMQQHLNAALKDSKTLLDH